MWACRAAESGRQPAIGPGVAQATAPGARSPDGGREKAGIRRLHDGAAGTPGGRAPDQPGAPQEPGAPAGGTARFAAADGSQAAAGALDTGSHSGIARSWTEF